MENSANEYHISFFKPTTAQAKANRNMVVWFVLIWFIAIFGFQILLRVIEKPTPEPVYLVFENVWENINKGTASPNEIQEFGKATLTVLGKINITPEEKKVLNNAVSWSVYKTVPDSVQNELLLTIQQFEDLQESVTDIADPTYVQARNELGSKASMLLNLPAIDVRTKILPLELVSENIDQLTDETKSSLPSVMKKYLIHNQSVLTDTIFLGFPFHYFYTAVFLLILFVGLCWLYCVKTDQLNAKLNIVD